MTTQTPDTKTAADWQWCNRSQSWLYGTDAIGIWLHETPAGWEGRVVVDGAFVRTPLIRELEAAKQFALGAIKDICADYGIETVAP